MCVGVLRNDLVSSPHSLVHLVWSGTLGNSLYDDGKEHDTIPGQMKETKRRES